MAIPFTRASRDYDFVSGLGGNMILQNRNNLGTLAGQSETLFDVGQWAIKQIYRNKRTTHSGSNGADLYTRVGAGWTFAAELSFPGLLAIDDALTGVAKPFAEQLVGSLQGVRVAFQVGEPSWWFARGLQARSYQATKFLADVVDVTCSSRGEDEVVYNVVGVGSSLLGHYLQESAGATPVLVPLF